MLMPAAMASSIAGMPSGVAGILIITFGRPSLANRRFASATVSSVSLREQRRDFEADVAVVAAGALVDRAKTSAALPMSSITSSS